MEWWLLIPNVKNFKFPVIPASYTVPDSSSCKKIDILNFGEYTIPGNRKAKELSFSCFFPGQEYYFCLCKPADKWDYIKWIEKARDEHLICRFVITTTLTNLWCYVENFTYTEETNGDLAYTLKLVEYRY